MVEIPIRSALVANRLVSFVLLFQRHGHKGTEMFRWDFSKCINNFEPLQVLGSDIQQHSAGIFSCHFSKAKSQFPRKNVFSFLPTFHEITFVLKTRTDNILSHISNKFKMQFLHKCDCWKTLQRKPKVRPAYKHIWEKRKHRRAI